MQPTHQNLLVTNLKEDNSCNFHSPSMHQNPDSNWTPSSWKSKPASQQAEYPNLDAYTEELNKVILRESSPYSYPISSVSFLPLLLPKKSIISESI